MAKIEPITIAFEDETKQIIKDFNKTLIKSEQIVKLREFLRLVKDTPETELHLLPLAADALLSELGE